MQCLFLNLDGCPTQINWSPLTNGFNRAMANLNIDAQLEDGIRMNLTIVFIHTASRGNMGERGVYSI